MRRGAQTAGDLVGESPKRILLVHNRYQQAGGEDAVVDAQAALLERHGHEVRMLVMDNHEISEAGGLLARIRLARRTIWSVDGIRRVREATRAFRPQVVHAHNTFPLLSPAIHGAARAEGAATVQTLHNYRLVCPSAVLYRDGRPCHDCVGRTIPWPGVQHACYRDSRPATAVVAAMITVHRARRTWARDVDQFVVLAAFARDRLIEGGLSPRLVTVQPNFIDQQPRHVDGPGEGFLFVGRLTEDKGIGTLLAACARLPAGIRVSIAGTGPLEHEVLAAASRNPSIVYLGRLDQAGVMNAISHARAVLVPSHLYENCPLAVLEAYAGGRPVIVSGHGGLAEIVVDGLNGFHVRPADPVDLADRLVWAAGHGDAMLAAGQAAQAAFVSNYSAERGYAGLIDVYERAIAVRRARAAAGS